MRYQPGQRVILFRPQPRMAIVSSERLWAANSTRDGKQFVNVAAHPDDAEEGRGVYWEAHEVQPYTDDLWAACERWVGQRKKLDAQLDQLSKGKIPQELVQQSLLGGSNE